MRISGCVIAKNEEKDIKTCIESMKKVAGEIILVDTGSTDKTVEIAYGLGAKIFYYEWDNNFANARNYALSKAKGDWILFLDADEYLTDTSVNNISFYLSKSQIDKYDSIIGLLINIDTSSGQVLNSLPSIRLFKNSKNIRYKGAIHENIVRLDRKLSYVDATERIQIIHTGYTPDDIKNKNKGKRNVELLLNELKKKPNDSDICYYLSESYEISGEFEKALDYAKKVLEYKNGNLFCIYEKNNYNIIKLMVKLNYPKDEIKETILKATKEYPKYPDFSFLLGLFNSRDLQLHDAVEAIEEGIKNIEHARLAQARAHFEIKEALGELGSLYYRLDKLTDSVEAYVESLKSDKYYYFALKGLMHVLLKHEKEDDVLEFMQKIYDFSNPKDLLFILMASLQEGKANMAENILNMIDKEYYDALVKDRALLYILKGEYREAENLLKIELQKEKQTNRNATNTTIGDEINDEADDEIDNNDEMNNNSNCIKDNIKDNINDIYKYNNANKDNYVSKDIHSNNCKEELVESKKGIQDQNYIKEIEIEILYAISLFLTGKVKERDCIELLHNDSLKNILKRLSGDEEKLILQDKLSTVLLIDKCIRIGRLELIEDILIKLPELNLYHEVAELFYFYEYYNIAAEYYNKFVESQEEIDDAIVGDILVKMGECMYRLGQTDLAAQFFRDAGNIIPKDYRIYEFGIMACEKNNNCEMLIHFIKEGSKHFPESNYILSKMQKLNNAREFGVSELKMDDETQQSTRKSTQHAIQQTSNNLDTKEETYSNDIYIKSKEIKRSYDNKKDKLKYQKTIVPKITIVIPTYNKKHYLKETIESCLQQDYPNLEVIVGDDCSTDGTHIMMKEYQHNKKIKYIKNKKNLGAGINSTYLLFNHVDSKYAMILNHDDYLIKKDYISTAVDFLVSNPNVSFVWANCKVKNEISGQEGVVNFKNRKIVKGIDYFINYETSEYPHITGVLTTVFDLEKLKLTQYGSEKTMSKDTFLYLNLMLIGDVGFINEYVSVYRVHKDSISLNMQTEFDKSTIEEFEKMKSYVLEKKLASKAEMKNWINNRIFSYVAWRFTTLWNSNKRKDALNILMSISRKYPVAYERILDSI